MVKVEMRVQNACVTIMCSLDEKETSIRTMLASYACRSWYAQQHKNIT